MENEGKKVLVVDSDAADLASTTALVETAGHQVVAATSFEEATRAARTLRPDLIVTQLRLGPYNGLHLVLRGRRLDPSLPAIIIARHPDPVLQLEAERLNAVYLQQPVAPETFLTALGRLLPPLPPVPAAGTGSVADGG